MIETSLNIENFNSHFPDEKACRDFLVLARWQNEIACPYCSCKELYHYKSRPVYRCKSCNSMFNVRTATIFSNTKISLKKWLLALYYISCTKNGISSVELAKHLNVTQKTAWNMAKDIRTIEIKVVREVEVQKPKPPYSESCKENREESNCLLFPIRKELHFAHIIWFLRRKAALKIDVAFSCNQF